MPYDTSNTPPNVPAEKRSSWAAQWNAVYARSIGEGKSKKDAEGLAFGVANKAIESNEAVAGNITPMILSPDDPNLTQEMLNNVVPSNSTTNDRERDEPAPAAKPADSNPEAVAPKDAMTIHTSDAKIDAAAAGYVELDGATKDADCSIVAIAGGVSKELGCCNLFKGVDGADEFKCGECKFVTALGVQELSSIGSTLHNLQRAYSDECNAHVKYLAFAKKAQEEGYWDIAGTLSLIASEEATHGQSHAAAIKALGAKPKSYVHTPSVGNTEANLLSALDKGEVKERDVTYPAYIAVAEREKQPQAVKSFKNALEGETKHASLLQSALDNLRASKAEGPAVPIEKVRKLRLSGQGMPFTVLLSMAAPTTAWDGKEIQDIPVACTGAWVKDEPFEINQQTLADIIANFKKRKNSQIVIDYEHASEHPERVQGQPIPAAGWIHDVYPRGNQLMGRVEWTPQAKAMIQTGQYRFFSPAINWGAKDKITGEYQDATLTSGALTNHPFLEELPPILLSEEGLMDVGQAHVPAALGDAPPMGNATPMAEVEPVDTSVPAGGTENPVVSACESAGPQGEAPLVAPQATVDANASEGCEGAVGKALADKQPYGDVKYADPGYQSDKQKRYPIDTEEHIRAAWNYIHKAKNAAKYSGDQASQIKSHIVSAWKEKIDKGGPPAAVAKEASETPMKSQVKKIADGKFKGRFGRYDEMGELLSALPDGMSEEALSAYCAELDDADPVKGSAQPGPKHEDKQETEMEPAGALLAEKEKTPDESTSTPDETPDEAEPKKPVKAAEMAELSSAEILKLITYPEGSKKAGRINLSEVPQLVKSGKIEADIVFKAQAAEKAVDEAIQGGKFLPKQRPHLMRQAMSDIQGFEEFVGSTPKRVELTNVMGVGSDGEGPDPVSQVNRAIKQELAEHKEDPRFTYADALVNVTNNNPELWEEYRVATTAPKREMREQ
jgi:rubrerythrin